MERFLFKWNPIALKQFFWRDEASLQSAPQASPVEFYDAQNIGQLQWPADSYSLFIKQLFCPLIENGTDYYFHNLKTTVKLLKFQELVLPIMINDHDYDNSYICSPYSFYISYAFESLAIFKNQQLKKVIMGALHVLSKIFHQNKFNKVIHVNNLPFSSTIYPPLDRSALKAIIDGLTNKFPEHAIIFRAFNYHLNGSECQSLKNLGASLIAYRQGYLLDTDDPHALIGKTLKKTLNASRKPTMKSSIRTS